MPLLIVVGPCDKVSLLDRTTFFASAARAADSSGVRVAPLPSVGPLGSIEKVHMGPSVPPTFRSG